MKQDILSLDNKNVGTIELPESIFGLEVRAPCCSMAIGQTAIW